MACVTACPSGVQYGPLIERTRAQIERRYRRTAGDHAFRALLFTLLPYPGRLRFALAPMALLCGPRVRSRSIGTSGPPSPPASRHGHPCAANVVGCAVQKTPEHTPAVGPARLKVGLLTGCVQRLTFPQVNRATINVLAAEGCSVAAPAGQGCCGALPLHAGFLEQARELARHNIATFERAGVDRIVVNAAGCGSCMKEYGELFADDPQWAGTGPQLQRARA